MQLIQLSNFILIFITIKINNKTNRVILFFESDMIIYVREIDTRYCGKLKL